MRDSQRTILAIGLVAALVQLVVWPPKQVFVHTMGGDETGTVRRWVPVWRPVEGIIQPTTGEQIRGFPSYQLQLRDPFTGRTMVVAREPGGQPQSASDEVPVLAEVAAIALAREDAERRLRGRPPTPRTPPV